MTFVASVHNPKIMLCMLIKVLCGDSIATSRRLSCEGNVTFEYLMRATSNFGYAFGVRDRANLRSPSRSASVINRSIQTQNPLSGRKNLGFSA